MKRRTLGRLALAGAATTAAAAGLGWQWRRTGQEAPLWQMRFDKPEGGELLMATLRGQPLVLNFWGSWCPPCVAEMPELDHFARENAAAGWQVLGLAVDNPKAVREFLAARPVGYTIALAGFEGAGLSRELGNSQGGLPFTVVFDASGAVLQRKAGQTSLAELRQWAQHVRR